MRMNIRLRGKDKLFAGFMGGLCRVFPVNSMQFRTFAALIERSMRTIAITDKQEVDEVIGRCDVCFVGINGADGVPYVIPMNFGYDGRELVLHSGPEGRHVELLHRDDRVCITFCTDRSLRCQHPSVACSYSMESASVVCTGRVSFLSDDDLEGKRQALNVLMRHYTEREFVYGDPALRNVRVWKVSIERMTAKAFGQNFKNRQV